MTLPHDQTIDNSIAEDLPIDIDDAVDAATNGDPVNGMEFVDVPIKKTYLIGTEVLQHLTIKIKFFVIKS